MRQINEGTALTGVLGTVLTPGTATGTGIDFTPYYEPSFKAVASIGVVSAGTAVVHVTGGTAVNDASVTYGTVTVAGQAAGTATYEVNVSNVTTRYVRAHATMTGGTVTPIAVTFVAKPVTT